MNKKVDILALVGIDILAIALSFAFHANFFTSTILFLGVPSAYLLFRDKNVFEKRKILIVTLIGMLFCFCFDFISELNKAWDWNGGLLFGKILGVVQIDVMAWFFLWVLHIFLFYEYFIDRKKLKSKISGPQFKIIGLGILSVIALIVIYQNFPSVLLFEKAYLVICLFVVAPFVYYCFKNPKVIKHAFPMLAYFAFVYLTHEITALCLEQWRFPGDYIGWVQILDVGFPLEELIFWIGMSSLVAVMYYERGFDNLKN
jgi:hypothetical protein